MPCPLWGNRPIKFTTNIDDFDCAAEHSHEIALPKTAKQQGVVLQGERQERKGYSLAEGIRESITLFRHTRADRYELRERFVNFD